MTLSNNCLKWKDGQKILSEKQWGLLKSKTLSNVEMMVLFLESNIPPSKKQLENWNAVFNSIYFAIYTHALEEYGKFLYLSKLTPSKKNNVKIEEKVFLNHGKKLDLVIGELKKFGMLMDIYYNRDDPELNDMPIPLPIASRRFNGLFRKRLNILHTDIDEYNNPTNIEFVIEPNIFRLYVIKLRMALNTKLPFKARK